MGLATSRPLLDSEISPQGDEVEEAESCWAYILRKLYSLCGYESLSFNDIVRASRRKRQRSGVNEGNVPQEDVGQQQVKVPRLSGDSEMNHCVIVLVEDETDEDTHEYLNFPFLTDTQIAEYISVSRVMFVMRGLPGSGKSTIVKRLSKVYPGAVVCSADNYFISEEGLYVHDRSKLKDAHQYSQVSAREACEAGKNVVIVDNTNVTKWECVPYFKIASDTDYAVLLVEPQTPWKFDGAELFVKNSHNVDRSVIEQRLNKWQKLTPLYYGFFLNVTDTDRLLAMMRELLEQCLDIADIHTDMANRTGYLKKSGIVNHYSRKEKMSHCTTRFLGRNGKEENPEETAMLGAVSSLSISAFIVTPRTIGARVMLSGDQLSVYRQPDKEVVVGRMSAELKCNPVIRDQVGPVRGRRAHVTLGCAPGVKPVQTGVDQLEVLAGVARGQCGQCHSINGGQAVVAGVGDGQWIIALQTPVSFNCIFTGGY